ncbi:exonuclease domain-containing protein [Flaviaesturariibacter aridisoli]|uniref:DNA polymerase III subunit epsilon n=1 Tax=Flaviaesturariibacter aridisoli TaxID=2545761 RepID=A0A4R4E3K9_9BACT|nr:exonuclease domain-containing protein [Flaviaesturariibacter aridisoli]TCZ74134.1 DNA polymerase III subunit epsilon [Flaviaesturariibacter aridisoli]
MEYAIVDIETTGGYAAGNGITEISIQVFDGRRVIDRYESLVNPGMSIPRYIQGFTGIDDEMVRRAPFFEEIAEDVYRYLDGRVFVAHNVNFDYSFVKSQLEHCGYALQGKKLCTVRLARQIFPGHPSYSLGNLCHTLGIELQNRHRAGGDAAATAELFIRLIEADERGVIDKSLKKTSKEQTLPPHVPVEDFKALPGCPGVYYFHDNKGKVVYVGKAKNIRSRVNSHFSNNSDSRQKQNFLRSVHRITCQPTATELMAAILESTEIKRLWPAFNQAQKKPEDTFGIFAYEDQAGYLRLAIEKRRRNTNPIYTFHYKVDGQGAIRRLVREFSLCPKLCFLQTDNEGCHGVTEAWCQGACEKREAPTPYNERVREAIAALTRRPSYVVIDQGMNEEESSCILVERGDFFGMGYLPRDLQQMSLEALKEYLQPYKDNSTIRTLLNSYIVHNPAQVHHLDS